MKITGSKLASVGILPVQRVEKIVPLDNHQPPRVPQPSDRKPRSARAQPKALEPDVVVQIAQIPTTTIETYGPNGKMITPSVYGTPRAK